LWCAVIEQAFIDIDVIRDPAGGGEPAQIDLQD